MPDNNGQQNLATVVSEVTERVSVLVRDEIELARVEVTQKVKSLTRGGVAVAAGAVFGVFAVFIGLMALGFLFGDLLNNLEAGFGIVFAILMVLAGGAVLFALKAFKKGAPPVPKMAIEEGKKIRETVSATGGGA